MQITTKTSFAVTTLQSTTCLTVMSCVTSGMRWTVNWRAATLHHTFLDHLESVVDDSVSTVILYRDGCYYQNHNVTLSSALIHFVVSRRKTIFQKFLEKGHTWMEVPSVHSATEGKLRGRHIFWPAEYIDVITAAKRDHPYEVKQVDHTFLRDFSQLNF